MTQDSKSADGSKRAAGKSTGRKSSRKAEPVLDSEPVKQVTGSSESYVVVARRYRPQSFGELVGQNQVAKALGNAIETNRVGHAYLFTGARGVGKTSTARIFSKCLNCETGPTIQPCDQCDLCEAISTGEDVDVLEIDGASNRGIDEIRQLRSFASVRPSRSRYKIYIIDEVHMLTKEAFNALLKTLEEPPPHVKFIFCTTNPEKIPITVLSRCQRFDFAPVVADEIKERLQFIVEAEGAEAEDAALKLLARRAGGSMRDSQSLLEQLLAFSSGKITVQAVHQMLGTAPGGRVETLVQAIADSNAAQALEEIHFAICEGADVGQVLEQLTGYFRDLLVLSVGSHPDTLLQFGPDQVESGRTWAGALGTTRILATLQIFDWALARMRQSTQIRCLLEIAVVQACGLSAMNSLANAMDTVGRIASGGVIPKAVTSVKPTDSTEKKNERIAEPAAKVSESLSVNAVPPADVKALTEEVQPAELPAQLPVNRAQESATAASPNDADGDSKPSSTSIPETPITEMLDTETLIPATIANQDDREPNPIATMADSLMDQYRAALDKIDGMIRQVAISCTEVQAISDGQWRVIMENQYLAELCKRQDRRTQIENTLEQSLGRRIRVDFAFVESSQSQQSRPKPTTKSQALREMQNNPYVARLSEIYSAEWTQVLPPRERKTAVKEA